MTLVHFTTSLMRIVEIIGSLIVTLILVDDTVDPLVGINCGLFEFFTINLKWYLTLVV